MTDLMAEIKRFEKIENENENGESPAQALRNEIFLSRCQEELEQANRAFDAATVAMGQASKEYARLMGLKARAAGRIMCLKAFLEK